MMEQFRQRLVAAKGFRDTLQVILGGVLIAVELYAIWWVLTAYKFESVVPVYQQF